jgi:tetratricopeptide (TPR) repeat protein
VVRGLLKAVDERNFSEPKLAADLAALAVKVADAIEPGVYPLDAITKLRGNARHELGYALYRIGAFRESLAALEAADELLKRCAVSEYDSADVALHRAQVCLDLERLDDGLRLTEVALQTFRRFGNLRRVAAVQATRATLMMAAGRYSEALYINEEIAGNAALDEASRAIAVYHAAICHREQSRFAEAKRLFAVAIEQYERLGLSARRAKARWSLGSVFALERRYQDALALFTGVRDEFADLGMPQDVALSSVDAAEALLMLGRPQEVVSLCESAIRYFSDAGITYSQGALMALAYLKEAAASNGLTRTNVQHVRDFFEVLPKQPHLLFAFPL